MAKTVTKTRTTTNLKLIAQVVRVLELRQRKATAATKTRGEVRGGGRKPWKQKGTGRARHGSIRSPIWRGGGVVFGPRPERHYQLGLPQKMRNGALVQLVALKKREGSLISVPNWPFKQGKTKEAINFLERIGKEGKFLIVTDKPTDEMKRATRNLPYVIVVTTQSVNAKDILNTDHIIIDKQSLETLHKRLGGSSNA